VKGAYGDASLESKGLAFWVVDDTGRALVTRGPLMRVLRTEDLQVPGRGGPTKDEVSARFDRDVQSGVISSIEVGEEVVVFGRVEIRSPAEGAPLGGYREGGKATAYPAIVPARGLTRLVSDIPEIVHAEPVDTTVP